MGKKRKKAKAPAPTQERAYEAAMSTPSRRHVVNSGGSQDNAAQQAFTRIRDWSRYLDENSDTASGILDELVKSVIGTGIITIPKPLRPDGSIDEPLGAMLTEKWRRWTRQADVTGELGWNDAQRMMARAWFRDGEQFFQHVSGRDVAYPWTADGVPYRIELLESDYVPWDLSGNGWRQGIRHNTWRQPTAYAVAREHPGDSGLMLSGFLAAPATLDDYKIVPAERMSHLKLVKRWPATRGISLFSTVISRLYDVKDLEESERIKNRILASWTAALTKSPDVPGYEAVSESGSRYLEMAGGTIIDSLAPGESITGVGPDYPVANLPDYLNDQYRRLASGTGTRHSSIAKNYNGTYAAQRQEMVESEGHYQIREDTFVSKVVRTVYERWLLAAIADGQVALVGGQDIEMAANAEFRGPITPWIDPLKEAQADALMVAEGFASIDQIRIKRGAPAEMIGTPAPAKPQPAPQSSPAQLSLIEGDDDEEEAA